MIFVVTGGTNAPESAFRTSQNNPNRRLRSNKNVRIVSMRSMNKVVVCTSEPGHSMIASESDGYQRCSAGLRSHIKPPFETVQR